MSLIKSPCSHFLIIGFIAVACNCDDKTKQQQQSLNAKNLPVDSAQLKLNHERGLSPHDIRSYRAFDTCLTADLTLPLKPLTTPAVREKDAIPPTLENPRARRGPHPQKPSPEALQKKYQSRLDFYRKHSSKTVRGLMIDGPRACDDINRVVSGNFAAMRYAYNKMLRDDPGLIGHVCFLLVIPASGEVIDCKVVEATMKNTILQDTLVNQVWKWRFDRLPDATDTTVVAFRFWCGS